MAVLTAYSRVTVVTSDRTVDLALPSGLPLADVMPQVMRYAAPDVPVDGAADGRGPVAWTLARLGGAPLPLSQTLADVGVLDGDVLELRPETEEVRTVRVEDVRDAVEDSVDAAGGVWSTRTTGSFAVLTGSLALAVAGATALLSGRYGLAGSLRDLDSVGSAVVAVLVLLGAAWWTGRFSRPLDAQVAAAVAMGWAALLGVVAGREQDLDEPQTLLVCVVLTAVAAGVARLLTDAVSGHASFAALVLVAGLAESVARLADAPADQVHRVLGVLAVLAFGVVPRVSLSVGGLLSADYRVRHVGQLDATSLRSRYRASNAILVGAVLALSAVVTWAGVVLERTGEPWDRTLALLLAAAAVLRSRLFSRTQHMVAPRVAGLVVLGFVLARLAVREPDLRDWLVAIVAVALAGGVALASLPMSDISRARVRRLLNTVEFVVIVVTVVVALGAAGVYDQLGGLFG